MTGIHVVITVANVSLDLLRPASATDEAGSELASAFSLQITDLRADMDILALMKADVKLRSFDIIDSKSTSHYQHQHQHQHYYQHQYHYLSTTCLRRLDKTPP